MQSFSSQIKTFHQNVFTKHSCVIFQLFSPYNQDLKNHLLNFQPEIFAKLSTYAIKYYMLKNVFRNEGILVITFFDTVGRHFYTDKVS